MVLSADEEAEQSTDLWVPMRECLNEWEQQSHSRPPCILNGQLTHKVLASVNGENPEWCEMAEQPQEDGDEMESGFLQWH